MIFGFAVMVGYMVALIMRSLGKKELAESLKKICTTVMQEGSIIKSLENHGHRRLPYKITAHKDKFTDGR